MDQETYEKHKETLAAGKIVISGGRTAATLEQLQELAEIEGGVPFGTETKFGTGPDGAEVMAIDSGRLTPAQIAEMGEDHPLIVASRRLTEPQLDALVDYFEEALAPAPADEPDEEAPKTGPDVAKPSGEIQPVTDVREAAVQAQMATGTLDAVTPKTALDNKTSRTEPAGKNASKAEGDAAQDREKAGAETAIG